MVGFLKKCFGKRKNVDEVKKIFTDEFGQRWITISEEEYEKLASVHFPEEYPEGYFEEEDEYLPDDFDFDDYYLQICTEVAACTGATLCRGMTTDCNKYVFGNWRFNGKRLLIYGYDGGKYYEEEVDPATLSAYTGRTDVNGKKIFQDDRVYLESEADNEDRMTYSVEYEVIDSAGVWILKDILEKRILKLDACRVVLEY